MADLILNSDDVLTVTNSFPSLIKGTAGENITAGDILYFSPSASKYLKAKADNLLSADAVGVACNTAANGQPVEILTSGVISLGAGLTSGIIYVLSSATAGALCLASDLSSGDYVTVIGIAKDADQLQVRIINSGAVLS